MANKKIKRSSHPVMFFIYLSIVIIFISGIADVFNFQVTYGELTTIAGEVESKTVAVNSLLSLDGLRFLISSAYKNLVDFGPFSSLLIGSIAFGIALKSGFLKSLCNKVTSKVPKAVIVFVFSLICILSSIDTNLGYVLLIPLGAVLFMSMGRNPIGGIALSFASIASGHGAGFFVNALDYNLSSYTEASSKISDIDYTVSQNSNLIFVIVAAFLIALVCTIVTEKVVSRKLGRNLIEEEETMVDEKAEKKGLIVALIVGIIYIIPIILMIIPGKGFIGLLLDRSSGPLSYTEMLFSSDALFMQNLVGIVSFMFALQGFAYGVVSGSIRKIRDMVNFSTEYLRSIGGVFVLIFFASGLCAIFEQTNLGTVITGVFANFISSSGFSFMPLILLLLFLTLILNVLVPSSLAKWSIIAPTVMPIVFKANIRPEFAQAVFRAGDSITNCITPLFSYFVIFIGFIEVFTKNKNEFSIKKCYKVILPYFGAIALTWTVMIISWYIAGFPIGPGMSSKF